MYEEVRISRNSAKSEATGTLQRRPVSYYLHVIYSHFHTYRFHPARKRQTSTFGSGFDGSFGVDSEDLANAPGVDFSSFQFFPDQNTFGTAGEIDLTDPNSIAQNGVDWVNLQAQTANTYVGPHFIRYLALYKPLGLGNLLPVLRWVFLARNRKTTSCLSIPMMRVSVQLNVLKQWE